MHQDDLSVLVFKENRTPRAFLIPLSWFSRMGSILAVLSFLCVIASTLAIRNYVALRNARRDFTREIEEEKRNATPPLVLAPDEAQPPAATVPSTQDAKNLTPPAPETTSGPPPLSGTLSGPLFSVFSRGQVTGIEDPAKVPIALKNIRTSWSGKTLIAKFEIHYVRDDGGNQQGRIFILARGPDALFVHPLGAFEPIGSSALLGIKRGEHFSVSRLRGVEARFEPNSQKQIISLETMILSDEGKLLIHEALPIK